MSTFASNVDNVEIWDKINPTANNMPNTEIPATFQIELAEDINFSSPQTRTNVLWTCANGTEHMGEYVGRFGAVSDSIALRSQLMLESYDAALNKAMKEFAKLPAGRHFNTFGGWELGINTETGVVYHARLVY